MMFRFRYSVALPLLLMPFCLSAQVDRKEVRAGNRNYDKGNWQKAEIEYRKAQVKDTASFAANFNLSDALYRQENYEEAGKALDRLKDVAPGSVNAADYYYNLGNVACMKKDWEAAVEAYKQSLLRNPGDVEAKENLAYATAMLKKEGGGSSNKDPDKDHNDNQDDENQSQGKNDQEREQNQGQDDQKQQQPPQDEAKISPQQAQQMLKAIQAREKETSDRVQKEKAALQKSRQKDKNW